MNVKFTRVTTATAVIAAAAIFSTGLSYAASAAEHGPAARTVAAAADRPMTAQEELDTPDGQRLIAALTVIDAMPDSVTKQGDAAVQAYLDEHLADSKNSKNAAVAFGWWQKAKCVTAVAGALASAAIPVAKLLKLKAFIKKVGSVKEAASLLIRVSKGEEKLSELGATLGGLAGAILGVDMIKKHCS
ncbi:hypothetical protein [Streptomyces sp. Je 1-332]|uniref:hypothetical protein n=1 Tax=Streptomyces sp. Je 1-332 TaxID=3231270 RepID=UPI0034597E3B